MRESVRLYIKNSNQIDKCEHISLIFVASSKLLTKNFTEINITINKLMESYILND